jgi:riboflavin-specific deaminase-like protein
VARHLRRSGRLRCPGPYRRSSTTSKEHDVRRLIPSVADESLEEVYAELTLPQLPDRPWVALGMVSSIDGAATRDGETAALGGAGDHHAFRALRAAGDAILVGAGTVRIEGYGPPIGTAARRRSREARGLTPVPRLVIVSGSLGLDPGVRVFADPEHPPLIVTAEDAPRERLEALRRVAEVVPCGQRQVDLARMLAELHARGLHRILCEGGPTLNGGLLRLDAVDEVFLTIDPSLLGGSAPRICVDAGGASPRRMRIVELREHQDELLVRYRRARPDAGTGLAVGG